MNDKHLHIVTHDVPWPADFGGVMDLFYKIKSLHEKGIKIHLHCFTSKRGKQPLLNKYCQSVTYYERTGFSIHHLLKPYIVYTRSAHRLLVNLSADQHPILMEGIHTTYWLSKGSLANKKVFVRLHNVEFEYYNRLASQEKNLFRKLYYKAEAFFLKNYERSLAGKASFISVSKEDQQFVADKFNYHPVHYVPVFVPWQKLRSETGQGNFCMYHGNLSINENENVAKWLLKEVFSQLNIPFVVAGKNPSPELVELAHQLPHTCIVANPSEHEMEDLIKKAQINILPSFNNTGVKLKLVHALFIGRHCITNAKGVMGSDLEVMEKYPETAADFCQSILQCFHHPFEEADIQKRKAMLDAKFNNEQNVDALIRLIY